jgi:hypothetical protein
MSEPFRLEHGDAEINEHGNRDGQQDSLHYIHPPQLLEQEKLPEAGRYAAAARPPGSLTDSMPPGPCSKRISIDPVPRVSSSSHRRYAAWTVETLEVLACRKPLRMFSLVAIGGSPCRPRRYSPPADDPAGTAVLLLSKSPHDVRVATRQLGRGTE